LSNPSTPCSRRVARNRGPARFLRLSTCLVGAVAKRLEMLTYPSYLLHARFVVSCDTCREGPHWRVPIVEVRETDAEAVARIDAAARAALAAGCGPQNVHLVILRVRGRTVFERPNYPQASPGARLFGRGKPPRDYLRGRACALWAVLMCYRALLRAVGGAETWFRPKRADARVDFAVGALLTGRGRRPACAAVAAGIPCLTGMASDGPTFWPAAQVGRASGHAVVCQDPLLRAPHLGGRVLHFAADCGFSDTM
jgi:hypothetical protein